ncbi:MAG: hypothetical protein JST45_12265 [Bacteroidetes bacterium]|nr:hypothetical protein [Bacteroidota bacterium]
MIVLPEINTPMASQVKIGSALCRQYKVCRLGMLCAMLALLPCQSVTAQDLMPLSDGAWHVDWGTSDCIFSGMELPGLDYHIEGDTTIGTHTYAKLIRSGVCGYCCSPFSWPFNGYVGGLRQDSFRVYIVPADSTDESVYADFSQQVGDTVNSSYLAALSPWCHEEPRIVAAVDSVQLNDNLYHKRITYEVCDMSQPFELIQGVGYSTGLLEAFADGFEMSASLVCCRSQGIVLYGNGPCLLVEVPEELSEPCSHTATPISNGWTIRLGPCFAPNERVQLMVFDLLGRTAIGSLNLIADGERTVELPLGKHHPLLLVRASSRDRVGQQHVVNFKLIKP